MVFWSSIVHIDLHQVFKKGESGLHLRGEHGTKDYVVSNVSIGILAPEKKIEGLKPYIDHTGNRGIKLSRSRFGTSNLTALKLLTQELEMTKQNCVEVQV